MITFRENCFILETDNTSYIIRQNNGLLIQLYYGSQITMANPMPLEHKQAVSYGVEVVYQKETSPLSLDTTCLDWTPVNKSDYRAQAVEVFGPNGYTSDMRYIGYRIEKGSIPPEGMPGAYAGNETLIITLSDGQGIEAELYYTVYEKSNVITRRVKVKNTADKPIEIRKLMSMQLDLPDSQYTLHNLTGSWARECHITERSLTVGEFRFGSTTGASSNRCNPFFMLCADSANEFSGNIYGFNLIYSGSWEGLVEVSPHGLTRVMNGLQSQQFCWPLSPNETFSTPESVLSFSALGKNGLSQNMHHFVSNHIVRGYWANKERPVLLNNWEGTYFDFNEDKLLHLAENAAELGVELFVLDDGWFGDRNGDNAGLGDYNVNRDKLPDELSGLADKIEKLGLKFGLWFEPEMVNEDSDLYRSHPDWIISTPGCTPSKGRNQYVLDLCRTEVQDYIIEQMSATLESANISYVKWDMNRHISDNFSPCLLNQGQFAHSYILGFYRVTQVLMERFPQVLFEGCSSGGNRFDLGMLCYVPQIWISDDTDAYERQFIQAGCSYGYPQSVMCCHVSAVPNHQTGRTSQLESRFDVAAFGILGYQMDSTKLTEGERKVVKAQIAWYKQHRKLLQFGNFVRLKGISKNTKGTAWQIISDDKKSCVAADFMHLIEPNGMQPIFRFAQLDADALYQVEARQQYLDIHCFGSLAGQIAEGLGCTLEDSVCVLPSEQEEYTAYGSLLCNAGIRPKQIFMGSGYNSQVRLQPDFSARLYLATATDK